MKAKATKIKLTKDEEKKTQNKSVGEIEGLEGGGGKKRKWG